MGKILLVCIVMATFITMCKCQPPSLFGSSTACGEGCKDVWCYHAIGCSRCQIGYCKDFWERRVVCVKNCSTGKYCHPLGFCTVKRTRNT